MGGESKERRCIPRGAKRETSAGGVDSKEGERDAGAKHELNEALASVESPRSRRNFGRQIFHIGLTGFRTASGAFILG
jgi:hypothetical protein